MFCRDSLLVVSLKAVLPTSSRVPKKLPSAFIDAVFGDVVKSRLETGLCVENEEMVKTWWINW